MDRINFVAYALGGACFVVLVSGCVDVSFWVKNPFVANLLGAAVPLSLVPSFVSDDPEVRLKCCPRRYWAVLVSCAGIVTSLVGLVSFFVQLHPAVGYGFAVGVCGLLSCFHHHAGQIGDPPAPALWRPSNI